MTGEMGVGLINLSSFKYCDLSWYNTSGTVSSNRCDDCDIGWEVDAHWDLAEDCFGPASPGKDWSFLAGHLTYSGYDYWAQSYDNGANWYYSFVYDGGGGSGYAYYAYIGGDIGGKFAGYGYFYHGFANY